MRPVLFKIVGFLLIKFLLRERSKTTLGFKVLPILCSMTFTVACIWKTKGC